MRRNRYDKYYRNDYTINDKDYFFSEKYFDEFIYKLRESYNIIYEGVPELILIEVKDGKVMWNKKIRFQLTIAERDGHMKTLYSFFDKIFEYAKEYVNINDISKVGRLDKMKESFWDIFKISCQNLL